MADKRILALAGGVAVVGYLAYLYRAHAPTVTLSAQAFGQSWTPYAFFEHQSPGVTLRHYPQQVGSTIFPLVIQNESSGLAMACLEVDRASYAQ